VGQAPRKVGFSVGDDSLIEEGGWLDDQVDLPPAFQQIPQLGPSLGSAGSNRGMLQGIDLKTAGDTGQSDEGIPNLGQGRGEVVPGTPAGPGAVNGGRFLRHPIPRNPPLKYVSFGEKAN